MPYPTRAEPLVIEARVKVSGIKDRKQIMVQLQRPGQPPLEEVIEHDGSDRYHTVRVKARRKGLTVRSKRGVFDFSHATQATMAAQGILLVGGDARTKRLVIEIEPRNRQARTFEAAVTVVIPLADLTPVEQGGKWQVEATLSTASMDKTGSFSDLSEIPLHLTLPEKPAPDAVARYHTKMKLRRIQQRLVVTVRDPLGGAAVWGETEIKQ